MRVGDTKEYPIWFQGHLRTLCATITTFISLIIVSITVLWPQEWNTMGFVVGGLQLLSFAASLRRLCRPAIDEGRRRCPPRWWLLIFDLIIGSLWMMYIIDRCYVLEEFPFGNSKCSDVELGIFIGACFFIFLGAFFHYQVFVMLANSPEEEEVPMDISYNYQRFPNYQSYLEASPQVEGAPNSNPQSTGVSEGQCPICMDSPQNAICIPCGHTAGCLKCLLRVHRTDKQCPICRLPINQVVKIHRV